MLRSTAHSPTTCGTSDGAVHRLPERERAFQGHISLDETYVLLTPKLAGIASKELGAASGSLAERRDVILGAMDFLLTGF